LDTLNFVIATSFNNCCIEPLGENHIDETLMDKGFQRTIKKTKKEIRSLNGFVFVNELKKKVVKTIVLIHKQIKNVNKILYKIFLVRKNYF
jgi:hypothetical protein